MTPAQHARLMTLFDEACELPKGEVPSFLSALVGEDVSLVPSLRDMLAVDKKTQIFFDQTRGGAAALAHDILDSAMQGQFPAPAGAGSEPIPTKVGEYEILERLGAGGMGSVYRAQQRSPERIVALKMLHPWLVSAQSLERFRFEAQALASLKHPSIPPVFTVGQHEGAVYFAMELVSGPNLTTWVAQHQCTVAQRVELLVKICDAVHHAHLRGFVHRDLKPDNIRVTDDGTPQVLDFGISAGLGERAEVAGTPAYMSPEQLEPGAVVDVRSDVFSLGIIAFELLAGKLPVVPPKTGLATLQALKKETAPRLLTLAPSMNSELDCIVARALEVAPEKRYSSVAELGEDLKRHLRFLPVAAYPGGRLYRFGRFVRRNRLAATAVTGIVIALATGAGVSLAQYFTAEKARAVAATEAERAKASLEFLQTVLQEADSDNAGGRGATIGQALDKATERLSSQHLDPHVEASVRASLANTYVGLGEWKNAEQEARLALEAYEKNHLEEDEELGEVYRVVAEVRDEAGDTVGAVQAGDRGLALEEKLHHGAAHTHVSYALHVAAIALREAGQLEQAVQVHQRAVAMERVLNKITGETNDLADALDQYGLTLVTFGRYDEAEAAHREALAFNVAKYGPSHQNPAIGYHHLAYLEFERGNFEASRQWLKKALEVRLATLGPDHMRVGMQRYLEARVELAEGHLEAAQVAETESLRIAKKSFGDQFGRSARLSGGQVLIWLAQGKNEEALALSQKILDFMTTRFGPKHYITEEAHSNHAMAQLALGHQAEAVAELEDVVQVVTAVLSDRPRVSREARARLAKAKAAAP